MLERSPTLDGKTDHSIQRVDRAVRIEHEREGQAELRRVTPDRVLLLTNVDPDDDEALRRELTVEALQDRHFPVALQTPGRPEVHDDNLPPEAGHRDVPRVDGSTTERRRRGAGGVADKIKRLEQG